MPGSETCLEAVLCKVLGELIQQEGCIAKLADDLYISGTLLRGRTLHSLKKNNLRLSEHYQAESRHCSWLGVVERLPQGQPSQSSSTGFSRTTSDCTRPVILHRGIQSTWPCPARLRRHTKSLGPAHSRQTV